MGGNRDEDDEGEVEVERFTLQDIKSEREEKNLKFASDVGGLAVASGWGSGEIVIAA
jgi:hypothetical protein